MSSPRKTTTTKSAAEGSPRKTATRTSAGKTAKSKAETPVGAVESVSSAESVAVVQPSVSEAAPAPTASESAASASSAEKLAVEGKPAAAEKPASKPHTTAASGARPALSAEDRCRYIEVAAYYIAERRGFSPGDPLSDWAQAEKEIDDLLRRGLLNP